MVVIKSDRYEHRNIFFFICKVCHKKRRSSLKEKKAREGTCTKCLRAIANNDPRQQSLLGGTA